MAESEALKWEKRDHIAILTLSRPKALNTFDLELMEENRRRLEEFEADDDLWVLIYTGEGRAFSAGVDIKKAAEFLHWDPKARHHHWVTPCSMNISKPTIAAVNGYALGGGCELALGCDIRIASEAAVFGLPEVLLGALPGGGGTQTLPRLVGLGDALLMLLTGESVSAAEALRIGLVQRVVPAERLLEETLEIAAAICRGGQSAVRLVKEVAQLGLKLPLPDALWLEQVYFQRNRTVAGEEIEERLRAFQQKRKSRSKDGKRD
ncbi:MAG: enoyl-CoA hydratase/isomerase family protein [Gammaproteobacteria bacterium]|nr:enoyl-CoA hydratase/isomerase family protein [Gammaproteobacteria bacterium]